jgi:glycosyltransferase involved in cell wall biosynthesis
MVTSTMRFLLNSRSDDAGTRVCITDLHAQLCALGLHVTLNDWSAYKDHDIVVFMGYDHDAVRARRDNPDIKVVLADPKLSRRDYILAARQADLLLVSSVEQRDSFLRLNSNILIHYMFPEMEVRPRRFHDHPGVVVAYHGNRVHLEAMRNSVFPALAELAKSSPVELLCIYNIAHLGRADLPGLEESGIKVSHVQWQSDTLLDTLERADIGIMPNELPIYDRQDALWKTAFPMSNFAYEPFDHLVRYKVSANPGRLLPFACAGLPVIADFCPSASQFIRDSESGFIVSSPHGWHFALSRLAESAQLRHSCGDRLREIVISRQKGQAQAFVHACRNLVRRDLAEISDATTAEEEQLRFNYFPRPQETPLRWLRRQLRKLLRD